MSTFSFTGVIPILATPFNDDESLDLASLDRMIRFNIEAGVDGVTLLGLLGESNRLTDVERARLVATAVKACAGKPLVVGTSHAGTAATIELTKQAMNAGAAAVMVTPSQQPTPSDKSVFDYFERIAKATGAPIVLQDHPAISNVHMPVDLILRLVKEIPDIVGIKAEALPSPAKIGALRQGLATIRPVSIMTGLGALYGLFDLERGSNGFNTGFAFPEVLLAILRHHRAGDREAARAIYMKFLPLLVFEQQPGLAIRKEILRRRGLIASNRVRHPGATIDPATAIQLESLLEWIFGTQDIRKVLVID